MKNPLKQLKHVVCCWWDLRRFPGLFSLLDALQQIHRVLLPARIIDMLGGLGFKRHLHTSKVDSKTHCVEVPSLKLSFHWQGAMDNNLFFMVDQELNASNPHAYLTPPISTDRLKVVLDVGSCEGLFAFRVARLASKPTVHCFEPFAPMGQCLLKAAAINHLEHRIVLHTNAVGKSNGHVRFSSSHSPDSGEVHECEQEHPQALLCVTVDQFLEDQGITMNQNDLIKIDAEGADFEVLLGAQKTISRFHPQIAVTTYHRDEHVEQIVTLLKALVPQYRMRLKGFSFWTTRPRPVLLQASCVS